MTNLLVVKCALIKYKCEDYIVLCPNDVVNIFLSVEYNTILF